MNAKSLARVAALYGQVERVRLAELQETAAAVAEAQQLRAAAEAAGRAHRVEGRAALARGEGADWRVAENACEITEVLAMQAEDLRAAREVVRLRAGEGYRASRMKTGQVSMLVEALYKAEAVAEERREQAAADDRYAARLCWSRMKAR